MKKTRSKHLFRTIKKNGVSFFAVAFIAAVSIAIFMGLQSGATAILKDTNKYFIDNKLETVEIVGASGLTKEDIETIATWEGVDIVEGGYSAMIMMKGDVGNTSLQAISLSDKLNEAVVVSGKLPETESQIAVEEIFAKREDIKVGDKITLQHNGELLKEEFEVTAIINHPFFCCANIEDSRGQGGAGLGSADYYVALDVNAFSKERYGERYTKAYVRNNELDDLYYFDEEYKNAENTFIGDLEKLAEGKEWTISGRNDIGDIRGVKTIVDGLYGLSYSMSIIFLLVAVVVCHAAISRMIDEQRNIIGAQKALGFSSGEILRHYMLYNVLCAALGVALGWIASVFIVEGLVLGIFTPEFLIGDIAMAFARTEAVITAVICFAIFLGTTYIACASLVKQPATELLRGEVPVQGKKFFFENFKIYKKLSLYSRTMIKNVLNDKGRMATTIMGVVGCIALLVICFSLKMAIEDSSVIHFDKYFLYDNRMVIDTNKGKVEDYTSLLDKEEISYTVVQDKLKNFRADGGNWENAHIVTTSDFEELKDFMVLEDIETLKNADIPQDGLLVSRKYAEDNDLKVGSAVEIMDSKGKAKEAKISGIIEHYLSYHLFVTTDSYYEKIVGDKADPCVLLLNGNIDGLYDKVKDMEGFISLKDNSEFAANADAINMVIAVCLVLSAVMALLVLLNQIVMHINRKSRELAVMRVNGYTLKETKAYVYKDNIVLTAMGLILGCGFGAGLSYIIVRIVETGANRYVRTPNLQAFLYASIVGTVFAVIVNIIALRKINKLKLTNVSGN